MLRANALWESECELNILDKEEEQDIRGNCKRQIVTSGSQVVTQPTTGDAQGSFASGSGRERAFSAWYERSMSSTPIANI